MKFTIDRSRWRCGDEGDNAVGIGPTMLVNSKGYMCCLGFVCEQLGFNKSLISLRGDPADALLEHAMLTTKFNDDLGSHYDNSDLCNLAIEINDNSDTTPQEKEKLLIELFEKYHHEIEFVGKYIKD